MPAPAQAQMPNVLGKFGNGLNAFTEVLNAATSQFGKLKSYFMDSWIEMQDIAFKTSRTMAMGRDQAMRYDRSLMASTKDLARQYGLTAQQIADFQKDYASNTGRNILLTKDQTKAIAALSKITDDATAASLIDSFDKIGIGVERATANVGIMQDRAKALGINANKAVKTFQQNIKMASSYSFKNGVRDIEKMALKATSLRMDMNAIMNAAEKFMDIEGAISTSANIQMLGGSFAQQFSNPMGAMYEAMADPKEFMNRIEKTIAGKGSYNSKTGAVEFDQVTMMQLREMAKQLGMSVDQLTEPAMAMAQNARIDQEASRGGNWAQFSDIQKEAVRNLSRNNVDETGRHYVTFMDESGKEQQKYVDELTEQELKIAQDQQKTEEELFGDVQQIKEILEDTLGRARGTTSTKENITGLKEEFNSFIAQFQNMYMGLGSGIMNGQNFRPWDWIKMLSKGPGYIDAGTHATEGYGTIGSLIGDLISGLGFEKGGIVKANAGALISPGTGGLVPGNSFTGDKVPAMVNSGEMIINQKQQKGLFDFIGNLAKLGGSIFIGNKLGKKLGYGGLGTFSAISGLLGGGAPSIGGMAGTLAGLYMSRKFGLGRLGMINPMMMSTMPMMNPMMMNPMAMMSTMPMMNPMMMGGMYGPYGMGMPFDMYGPYGMGMPFDMYDLMDMSDFGRSAKRGRLTQFGRNMKALSIKKWRGFKRGVSDIGSRLKAGAINKWGEARQGISTYAGKLRNINFHPRIGSMTNISKPIVGMFGKVTKAIGGQFTRLTTSVGKKFGAVSETFSKATSNISSYGSKLKNIRLVAPKNVGGRFTRSLIKAKNLFSGGKTTAIANVGKAAAEASKFGKVTGILSKVGRIGGKLGGAGAVLSVLGMGAEISSANQAWGAQKAEIENSNMSKREKAAALDAAEKEKNKAVGSSVGRTGGGLAGMAAGAAIGSIIPGVGTVVGGLIGGLIGGFGGGKIGKAIGGLFGGGREKKLQEEGKVATGDVSIYSGEGIDKTNVILASIDSKMAMFASGKLKFGSSFPKIVSPFSMVANAISSISGMAGENSIIKSLSIEKLAIGNIASLDVSKESSYGKYRVREKTEEDRYKKVYVSPIEKLAENRNNVSKPTDINLNINGSIKIEAPSGKSADIDISKLIDNPEFRRQLAELVSGRLNEMSNAGKRNLESERNNMASQYDRTGR